MVQNTIINIHYKQQQAHDYLYTSWKFLNKVRTTTSICNDLSPVTLTCKWKEAEFNNDSYKLFHQTLDEIEVLTIKQLTSEKFLTQSTFLKIESYLYDFFINNNINIPNKNDQSELYLSIFNSLISDIASLLYLRRSELLLASIIAFNCSDLLEIVLSNFIISYINK